jgi:hypothetical protein
MAPRDPIKSDQNTWRRGGHLASGYLASFLPLRYLLGGFELLAVPFERQIDGPQYQP